MVVRSTIVKATAVVAAVAAVVAGAILATGYDAQQVDELDTAVWVTRDAGQYARVDTDLAEIDTVRDAEDPTGVVQSGGAGIVYTGGYQRMWPVNAANPQPLVAADAASGSVGATGATGEPTPSGTRQVVASGPWTVYLTDSGRVSVADLTAAGAAARPVQIDPLQAEDDADPGGYAASAVAVSDDGLVVLYSAAERAVRTYDARTATFVGGADEVRGMPEDDAGVLLTIVGGRWVLAAPAAGLVWVDGRADPAPADLGAEAVLQRGASTGETAYLATASGLLGVSTRDGVVTRVADAAGTPAQPTPVDGVVHAAWLASGGGTLWSADAGSRPLDIPAGQLDEGAEVSPVIASNGRRAVLNETRTGMLWTIPDGTVIPLSQWTAQDDEDVRQDGAVQVPDVAQQEPPVAEDDAFGVRRGTLVALPVLLNDHDPNRRDVLTVDPASIRGGLADPSFGTLALTDDDQQLVVRVQADTGSTTFTYAVGDGQEVSPPATVTLTVAPDDVNTAPEWCGVEGCLQQWPTASIAPGGTVSLPVLDAWVDPEGDPVALASAVPVDPAAPLTVLPTADGRVAIRHGDPNAAGGSFAVTVVVTDARGATATKELSVDVTSSPALVLEPMVVVAGIDQSRTVNVADHVRGGSGSSRLVDAVTSGQTDGVTVTPNVASGTIALTSRTPGDFAVSVTVQDVVTEAQQTATLRFRVSAEAGALALPPLTAFVRANEDTTLDILPAVQSTSGRVLALAAASTTDPGLSVSVVENAQLRLSGTTAAGRPGVVGTADVTVADSAGVRGEGTVTVFLVEPIGGVGPIAVPDAVTVRAGAQIDIPVTANDIAPRGERIVTDPRLGLVDDGADGELAFVAGSDIRYLAPRTPGTSVLQYSVYLDGDPSRLDSAAVTVTVVAAGENRAPEPRTLTARVTAGGTVVVPVPRSGMDPDGDATVLVGVEQPRAGAGAATIGADGSALTYTAPSRGVEGGQVSIPYTLRDGQGAEGVGIVRIGVLDARIADVAPVTYSDAVRAVVGSAAPLTVQPLANDRDPARGTLQLVDVVPNVPEGTPEHDRLRGLIQSDSDLAAGIVRLTAGDVQGVQSYRYTARSTATSSTAQGLIVVTVAADAAPDQPVVADTVLTIADRARLAEGIDVVSGKTVWASGDVRSLRLAVWGEAAARYSVSGSSIVGQAPAAGDLVPFSLTGADAVGADVVAYGFLRIPAFDDMRVQLVGGAPPARVGEESETSLSVAEKIQTGAGDRFEVRGGAPFAVQRQNASCAASGPATVVYAAGAGAPWTDSCTVAVRIVGQETWTMLPLPVIVEPKSPQAVLGSLSRTIAPGQSQTIDLYTDLTTWEGGRVGDPGQLDYRVGFAGGDFVVEQTGRTVTITARADARPGSRQTADVSVSGFGGLSSTVTLVVGAAPVDAPRGATFTRTCTVSDGDSCTIDVVGGPGEYDPFAGQTGAGLRVVSVGDPGCAVARVSVSGGTSLTATWPAAPKPAGGTCRVTYTVQDAQGRTGTGTVTIDVQGYPAPPRSVTTTAYTGSSVTLLVTLGEAAVAVPETREVAIFEGSDRVRAACAPAAGGTYSCTVGGLVNGQRHAYTARAINAVGESLDTSPVVAWAYSAPVVRAVTATPVLDAATSRTKGAALVRVDAGDDVERVLLEADSGETSTIRVAEGQAEATMLLPVGAHTIRATPVSEFSPPIGAGNSGEQQTASVRVAGAPYLTADGTLAAESNTSLVLNNVSWNENFSVKTPAVGYAVWREGQSAPSCDMSGSGGIAGSAWQSGTTFTGLQEYTRYFGAACVVNGFGAATSATLSAYTFTATPGAPTELTYTVDTSPVIEGSGGFDTSASWLRYSVDEIPPPPNDGFVAQVRSQNYGTSGRLVLSSDRPPGSVKYAYCWKIELVCGAESDIRPTTVPTTATVRISGGTSAVRLPAESDLTFSGSLSGDVRNVMIETNPDTEIVTYRVKFTGAYELLGTVELTRPYDPPPPPEAEPGEGDTDSGGTP